MLIFYLLYYVCCSAQNFNPLCSILCSLYFYFIVLIFICIKYNLQRVYIRFFAIVIIELLRREKSMVNNYKDLWL